MDGWVNEVMRYFVNQIPSKAERHGLWEIDNNISTKI